MKNLLKYKIILLFIIILSVFLTSCSRKNYKYIEVKKNDVKSDTTSFYKNPPPIYRLQPQDILYLNIITTDLDINKMFSIGTQGNNFNNTTNGGSFFLSGFSVSDSGYIEVPIVGKIKVVNYTMNEVQKIVANAVKVMLPNAIVNVKLVSFKVTFLGEVNRQGPQFIYQDKINILEALGRVGGITDYGDKANVTIVRPTSNGQQVLHVDVSDRKLLESKDFYLYSEDVVIVEPIKSKIFRLNVSDYTLIISTIVSTASIVFLALNLTK